MLDSRFIDFNKTVKIISKLNNSPKHVYFFHRLKYSEKHIYKKIFLLLEQTTGYKDLISSLYSMSDKELIYVIKTFNQIVLKELRFNKHIYLKNPKKLCDLNS